MTSLGLTNHLINHSIDAGLPIPPTRLPVSKPIDGIFISEGFPLLQVVLWVTPSTQRLQVNISSVVPVFKKHSSHSALVATSTPVSTAMIKNCRSLPTNNNFFNGVFSMLMLTAPSPLPTKKAADCAWETRLRFSKNATSGGPGSLNFRAGPTSYAGYPA